MSMPREGCSGSQRGERNAGMESEKGIRETLGKLLAECRLAVLATQRAGQPYASLVAFAVTDDLRCLYFATPRSTRKFANLAADGRIALLISNDSDQMDDFHRAMAVTVVGAGSEIDGEEKSRALDLYLGKHPYLEEFVGAPTCALVEMRVRSFFLVSNFQNVVELHLEL